MIEPLIKPQTLDNDIAVMKIIQLLGQLSLNDLKYILTLTTIVYSSLENLNDTNIAGNFGMASTTLGQGDSQQSSGYSS